MKAVKSVDEYISKHERWQQELKTLREIILSTELQETIKWGAPVYTVMGKNVVGLGAFKNYVSLWFFQGAFLKDERTKLINAQENKTKALRQWRFTSLEEIRQDTATINAYLLEAITNQKQGKAIKPARNKSLIIPAELETLLSGDSKLKECFEALSKTRRREYAEYIAEAKREETKKKRLEKIAPMIREGIGLHDKYRK